MGRYNKNIIELQKSNRIGEERYNRHGCLMRIIEYKDFHNITVEFQDEYKFRVYSRYDDFLNGNIKNIYYPSVYDVGIIGNKYPISIDGIRIKEYKAWKNILTRCFDTRVKEVRPTYQDVACCEEWLLYENFYEWIHSQSNFDKWLNGNKWAIDKDILIKGNKVYSSEACCLVPNNVNILFTKRNSNRGLLPIGVTKSGNKYRAACNNPLTKKREHIGNYSSIEAAFVAYKIYKENIIKQVAEIEYCNDDITTECYCAMLNYQVEITD